MRGFSYRVTVEHAVAWIDRWLQSHSAYRPSEQISLSGAARRVLASDVVSAVDVPGFARAMMDGFAVRAADTQGATPYNRIPLVEIGTSMPGRPFTGRVETGQAVRTMTGAPLSAGADAVLPAEMVDIEGHATSDPNVPPSGGPAVPSSGPRVFAVGEVPPGKHIGKPGEDIVAEAAVLHAGRRLRPQDLGVLSSVGVADVAVVRRPRVRIVITGDELLPAGSLPKDYRITDANGPMLTALVERDGGLPIYPGIVPDDRAAVREALEAPAEVILVSGGSSVGQEDHAPRVLDDVGELAIHGIAMRPSSPTGMGTINSKLVFLLPGNPVSCLCAYDFFAGRAIRVLAGLSPDWPYRSERARLVRKLVSVVGRVDYARVQVVAGGVEPLAISGASILSSTTRADGFVIVPGDSEGYPAGAEVDIYRYE